MLFNSIDFFIYFPIVAITFFVLSAVSFEKFGNVLSGGFLLVASMYFYMCWKAKYIVLIGFSIVVTYIGSIIIDRLENRFDIIRKITLAAVIFSNLLVLFLFKYYGFFSELMESITNKGVILPIFKYALPVGISFYTFQALGYTIDVYRKDIKVEKNPFTYALFVCFFPQLVAGPIERATNLLPQFHVKKIFEYQRMKRGLLLIAYGLFQKVVLADRIAVLVDNVYNGYTEAGGVMLAFATVLFSFQIYCDFCSYSNIAIGAAEILGFKLMKNFNAPYFATSIKDFWRRWHISLSTWFKDYIYIPLGGSRCSLARNCLNNMIVFLISGLWHGANMTFVVWGALHGFYQVVQTIFEKKVHHNIDVSNNKVVHILKVITTFVLVNISWVFFRATNITRALDIIKRIFTDFNFSVLTLTNIEAMGLGIADLGVVIISILFLLVIDKVSQKFDIRNYIMNKPLMIQWTIYITMIFVIVILGYYGPEYSTAPFIYFQF